MAWTAVSQKNFQLHTILERNIKKTCVYTNWIVNQDPEDTYSPIIFGTCV